MGLFRPSPSATTTEPDDVDTTDESEAQAAKGRQRKTVPTPKRKDAEQARRDRVTPVLSSKEARQKDRQTRMSSQRRAVSEAEKAPERVLLRDYVDSRWNVGEFLLPVMIVVLAFSLFAPQNATVVWVMTAFTWTLFLTTIVDMSLMWRGFKKLLAQRYPQASSKGLLMVAVNRAMSIRRFRQPPPRVKRGQKV